MAYENFMGNKDFHPSSFRNLKKLWEAEQRKQQEEKRQEDLRQQYLKEQEMYKNKELLGRANPLGFMYEPPPGFAKDKEKEGGGEDGKELKLKFDWQKTGKTAPREDYAKDMELRDKPFGIEVRNVKCVKCDKWGHINTDRELILYFQACEDGSTTVLPNLPSSQNPLLPLVQCPLYGKARPEPAEGAPLKPMLLDLDTVEDGMIFKQCVRDRVVDSAALNQQILASDEETEVQEMLAGFSRKERKRILRKLAKVESKGSSSDKKRRKKKAKRHKESCSASEEEQCVGERKHKRRHTRAKHKGTTSSSSEDEDSSHEERGRKVHGKKQRHCVESSGSSGGSDAERKSFDRHSTRQQHKHHHSKFHGETNIHHSSAHGERDRHQPSSSHRERDRHQPSSSHRERDRHQPSSSHRETDRHHHSSSHRETDRHHHSSSHRETDRHHHSSSHRETDRHHHDHSS